MWLVISRHLNLNPPVNAPPSSYVPVRHSTPRWSRSCDSDVSSVRRITFADKITLGQSAVLGIMCVNTPSACVVCVHMTSHQSIEPPLGKPVQLAWDNLFALVPCFRVPAKPGSPTVSGREVDEVCWKAYRIVPRLTTRQASISSFGPSPCCLMQLVRVLVACLPSVSFSDCVRERSPQDL